MQVFYQNIYYYKCVGHIYTVQTHLKTRECEIFSKWLNGAGLVIFNEASESVMHLCVARHNKTSIFILIDDKVPTSIATSEKQLLKKSAN